MTTCQQQPLLISSFHTAPVSQFVKLKCCLGSNTAGRELPYSMCINFDLLHWKGQGPDARYRHQAVLCCSAFTWLNACRRGQSSAGGQWCGLKELLSQSLKKPQQRCPWAKQLFKMCLPEITFFIFFFFIQNLWNISLKVACGVFDHQCWCGVRFSLVCMSRLLW